MKLFHKRDLIIVGVLLLVAGAFWLGYQGAYAQKPAQAEIYLGAQLVRTLPLKPGHSETISLPQRPQVSLVVEDATIRFSQSDCPDQVCVRAGKLHKPGHSAACLPNGIIVKILPQNGDWTGEADVVIG